jgi:hypothetical protein
MEFEELEFEELEFEEPALGQTGLKDMAHLACPEMAADRRFCTPSLAIEFGRAGTADPAAEIGWR